MQPVAPLLGAFVGLVLAVTGAGGAILAVPLLVFVLHLGIAQAGPVGLLAVALATGVGAVLALQTRTLRYKAAAVMAGAGWATSPLGLAIAQRTANAPLAVAFALVLVAAATRMFLQARHELDGGSASRPAAPPCMLDPHTGKLHWTWRCAARLMIAGAAAGFLSGLLGVGGGFIIVPALLMVTDLPLRTAIATSMGVIALVSLAGVLNATFVGVMPWDIAWPFAAGAVGGVLAGRLVAARVAGPRLQQGFALVCVLAAAGLFARALAS